MGNSKSCVVCGCKLPQDPEELAGIGFTYTRTFYQHSISKQFYCDAHYREHVLSHRMISVSDQNVRSLLLDAIGVADVIGIVIEYYTETDLTLRFPIGSCIQVDPSLQRVRTACSKQGFGLNDVMEQMCGCVLLVLKHDLKNRLIKVQRVHTNVEYNISTLGIYSETRSTDKDHICLFPPEVLIPLPPPPASPDHPHKWVTKLNAIEYRKKMLY